MKITKLNNGAGGSNGAAVTSANSGGASGDAFPSGSISSPSGSIVFDHGWAAHGTYAYKLSPASGQQAVLRWTGFNDTSGAVRYYVKTDTLPGAGTNEALMSVQTSTGSGVIYVGVNANGTYNVGTGASGIVFTTTALYASGDRIELSWTVGTSTSNGSWKFALYRGDAKAAVETKSSTAANLGTTNWDRTVFGKSSTSKWTGVIHYDDLAAASGTTTFFGPAHVNVAPTADAGAPYSIVVGTAAMLSGAGSDSDGTIASYAWTQTSGTTVTLSSASAQNPTFTTPSTAGTLTFSLVVTDDGGATSAASTVGITVTPAPITKVNSAAGGTNGTAVTTANSGGTNGDAFPSGSISSPSGSIVFDNSWVAHGAYAYKFSPASGQQALARWTSFNNTSGAARCYVKIDGLPRSGTNEAILSIQTSVGAGVVCISVNADGTYNVATGVAGIVATTTATHATGDRLELSWTVGSTTATGSWHFALYRGDSATATETKMSTTANLGTTNWDRAIFGKSSNSAWTGTIHIDDLAAHSGKTAFFGPVAVANLAPTAHAGPNQAGIAPNTVVTLGGSGADSDGTIASYSWTQTSGIGVTLSSTSVPNPTFIAPASISDHTLGFALTVTDNGGDTSPSDGLTVGVLAATEFYLSSAGVWTPLQILPL